jgi:hypothetical protein
MLINPLIAIESTNFIARPVLLRGLVGYIKNMMPYSKTLLKISVYKLILKTRRFYINFALFLIVCPAIACIIKPMKTFVRDVSITIPIVNVYPNFC